VTMNRRAGAKDAGAFLYHMSSGRVAWPSDITYEGVFYGHYFSVPPTETDIVKVEFETCASKDPISGKLDYFVSLGTSSKFDGTGLVKAGGRPPVHLMFVLDISGSMGSLFYERSAKQLRGKVEEGGKSDGPPKTKMTAAIEAICGLLDHLGEKDSFGLVVFDTKAETLLPLTSCTEEFRASAKAEVRKLKPRGGTNLSAGMTRAMEDIKDKTRAGESDHPHLHQRIFYLTDMNPNTGSSDTQSLLRLFREGAESDPAVYSTVIGFGVDFNTDLTESFAKVRGLNYFSVHSPAEFLRQMTWDFDYLVFPIAFDVEVRVADDGATGCKTLAMCGSPTPLADLNGALMYTNTVFPSQTMGKDKGESKGAIFLAKVALDDPAAPVHVITTYRAYDGTTHKSVAELRFPEIAGPGSPSIRKGVLLARYVALMKAYCGDYHLWSEEAGPSASKARGIDFSIDWNARNQTVRKAGKRIEASDALYLPLFQEFLQHYEEEEKSLDDLELGVWRDRMRQLVADMVERKEARESREEKPKETSAHGAPEAAATQANGK